MKEANWIFSQKDSWFRRGGFTSTLAVTVTPMGALADKKDLASNRMGGFHTIGQSGPLNSDPKSRYKFWVS